jgi:hypothetical protein
MLSLIFLILCLHFRLDFLYFLHLFFTSILNLLNECRMRRKKHKIFHIDQYFYSVNKAMDINQFIFEFDYLFYKLNIHLNLNRIRMLN